MLSKNKQIPFEMSCKLTYSLNYLDMKEGNGREIVVWLHGNVRDGNEVS